MDKQFVVMALFVCLALALAIWNRKRKRDLYPFFPKEYNFGKRRKTFKRVLQLLNDMPGRVLVETGTARRGVKNTKSDGASTVVFAKWAKEHDAKLYSVDLDPQAIEEARQALVEWNLTDNVSLHASDSIAFLSAFPDPIDFLYLDSMDYPKDAAGRLQSQEHHLREFKAIEHRLHDKTLVLIDDCAKPGGGKGKLVIEYMLGRNWKIMINAYQVLLKRA